MTAGLALLLRSLGVAAMLFYVGFPVRRLLVPRRTDPFGAEAMIVGGAVALVAGWYVSDTTSAGMSAMIPWVLLAATGLWPLAIVRHPPRIGRHTWHAALLPLAVGAIALATFLVHLPVALDRGLPGPVSLGNNDVASYALSADHLLHDGFNDAGEVARHHMGVAVERDHVGSFLLLADAAAATRQGVWEVQVPLLVVALYLIVSGLTSTMTKLLDLGVGRALLAAWLAVTTSMFFYSVGHVFAAQMIGFAAAAVMLPLVVDISEIAAAAPRQVVRPVLLLGLAQAWLVLTYPHASFMGLPLFMMLVVGFGVGLARTLPDAVRTVAGGVVAFASSIGVGVLLLPERFSDAVRITLHVEDAPAGWPLGRVTWAHLLGMSRFPAAPTGGPIPDVWSLTSVAVGIGLAIALGVTLVVAIHAALVRMEPGPARARWFAVALLAAAPFAVTGVFYARYGEDYQAWKAAAFYQPLAPAVGAALLLVAVASLSHGLPRRARVVGGLLVGLGLVMTATAVDAPWRRPDSAFGAVAADHRAIARAVDEQGPPEVNVDIGSPTPFWDNMWVIYFIEGRRIHSVRPTYVTVSSPDAAWTVRWRAERPPPGEERVAVHGRFALDRVVSLGPR